MALPPPLRGQLRLPLIAAPMTGVSGPELVVETCRNGAIGAFPTHNARSIAELDRWLVRIAHALDGVAGAAPFAPNLIVHHTNTSLLSEVECLVQHGVELVITSVGSPEPVVTPLHQAGCLIFADVMSLRHVDRALEAGVDGLVLLTAGAGGQTGSANALAFTRAVRARFDGPIALAGGVSDGAAILAAQALGADLAYMGTKFIATRESLASQAYREAVVTASLDEITHTTALSGLPANFLRTWLERQNDSTGESVAAFTHQALLDNTEVWAAGHSVSGVDRVRSVAELVESTAEEYHAARQALARAVAEPHRIEPGGDNEVFHAFELHHVPRGS